MGCEWEAKSDVSWYKLYVPKHRRRWGQGTYTAKQQFTPTQHQDRDQGHSPRSLTEDATVPVVQLDLQNRRKPRVLQNRGWEWNVGRGNHAEEAKDVVPSGLRWEACSRLAQRNTKFPNAWPENMTMPPRMPPSSVLIKSSRALNKTGHQYWIILHWWLQQTPSNTRPVCSATEWVIRHGDRARSSLFLLIWKSFRRTQSGQGHSYPRSSAQKMGWWPWLHYPLPEA